MKFKHFLLFISIYLLIITMLEYILVDRLFIIYNINYIVKFFIFLSLALVFILRSSAIFLIQNINSKISWIVFITSFLLFNYYTSYHNKLMKIPYIKSISYTKVIQGDIIEIRGRGFGEEWENGKVLMEDVQLIKKKWSNNKIVAEIPVPIKYGQKNIYVVNRNKLQSNHLEITVFDPTPVLKGEIQIR